GSLLTPYKRRERAIRKDVRIQKSDEQSIGILKSEPKVKGQVKGPKDTREIDEDEEPGEIKDEARPAL
ncbi:MAG: hypothetical protein K6T17_03110, partial [Fimbriimonadales bacterium]|nr:hypothetical protein [Fimbriimonadales bacterium]